MNNSKCARSNLLIVVGIRSEELISQAFGRITPFVLKINGSKYSIERMIRYLTVISMLLFNAACQTLPDSSGEAESGSWLNDETFFSERFGHVSSIDSWRLRAKVGVVTPSQREAASLVWQHRDQSNEVRLFGPLGVGAVTLTFDDNGAQLSDKKGVVHQGANAQALLTRIIGWPIPMDALNYWLFALPQPNAYYDYQIDELGQLKELRQFGWQISYENYANYEYASYETGNKLELARKIKARKTTSDGQEVSVRLIVKNWEW